MTMYILFTHSAVSQYEDRVWLMGYESGPDTTFGTTMMDFNFDPVKIVYIPEQTLNIDGLFAGISDSTGILLYTNGMQIRNKSYEIVPGGDTISFGPFWESWTFDSTMIGLPLTQGALILPIGAGSIEYAIFHSTADFLDEFGVLFVVSHIYQTIIDVEANSGQGSVLMKDNIIVNDTLAWGKLVACRHANGDDWWILAGRRKDNVYYRMLFTLNGGITVDTQKVGNDVPNGVGQAGFALNGNLYFRYEGLFSSDTGAYVNIYDFDRCTGRLSNHRWWTVPSYGICGAAASPNGRYLYVTTALELLQYDLLAEDIEASKMVVAEYDGYVEPGWFGTYFGKMHLAPDGRIYMVPTTGGSMVMHVIDKPNIRGPGCNLLQHDIKLPTWNRRTLPNFPDFSLGALPDGYCDSLTESRSMHAFFEYTVDSINPNAVDFTDLSWYNPVSWSWDFGDGQTSTVQHPVHVYETVGPYQICLVVSNTLNTDTLCIEITLTDTTGPEMTAMFSYEVVDTALNVLFMDQSYTDPESWLWDFGDGATSEQQHPEHTYDIDGTYTVCLGVSNGFATDTVCQQVVLAGTTAIDLVSATDTPPVVSPNPFSSFLDFTPPTDREIYDISIIDVQGRIVLRVEMSCPCRIMMDLYLPGVYIYQVRLRNGSVITGKLVKI
jgi:PKD repeat protein